MIRSGESGWRKGRSLAERVLVARESWEGGGVVPGPPPKIRHSCIFFMCLSNWWSWTLVLEVQSKCRGFLWHRTTVHLTIKRDYYTPPILLIQLLSTIRIDWTNCFPSVVTRFFFCSCARQYLNVNHRLYSKIRMCTWTKLLLQNHTFLLLI